MGNYIALLRGINVSGQKKIKMEDLRSLLSSNEFENIRTYIQSGNIVFTSATDKALPLEHKIAELIKEAYGFDVPVLVLAIKELEIIMKNNPFKAEQQKQTYFTLLSAKPSKEAITVVESLSYEGETVAVTANCVYFFSEKGYGKAKMNTNFLERKLKVTATTRNYKTMEKLILLASE